MYAGVLACFSLLKEKDIYLPQKNANLVKFVEKRRKLIFLLKIFAYIRKKQYLCNRFGKEAFMVVLAQLAEHRIVVPSVVGSSPTFHPNRCNTISYGGFSFANCKNRVING